MVNVLGQTAPALSQERTLNFEWGVVEPQWILLGLNIYLILKFFNNFPALFPSKLNYLNIFNI